MKRAIFIAPFGELSDPALVAELAAEAEAAGWDGFFVWDHVVYSERPRRRRPVDRARRDRDAHRARDDRPDGHADRAAAPAQARARDGDARSACSGGRLVLGVGLGGERHGEFAFPGEEQDPRERARLLDEGLDRLQAYWGGELQPPARVPVWVAGRYPNRRPLRRAARYDGYFPIDLPGPDALAELVAELPEGHDVVVAIEPGEDHGPVGARRSDLGADRLRPRPEGRRRARRDRRPQMTS